MPMFEQSHHSLIQVAQQQLSMLWIPNKHTEDKLLYTVFLITLFLNLWLRETKALATLHRVSKFKWLGKEYLKQTKTIERFHFFISLILTNKTILSKYKNSFIYSTNRLRCSSINDLDFLLRIYFKSFRRDHRFYCHVTFDLQSIIDQLDSFYIVKKTIVYRCYKDGLCLFLCCDDHSMFNSIV